MPTPKIDKSKCTNSGTCIDVCPMNCFEKVDGKVEVVHPKECIGCKACEVQCPAEAITVDD